jgi:hypothetical protein
VPPLRPTSRFRTEPRREVWAPFSNRLEYQIQRERAWKIGGGQPWKDVDPIFIDDSLFQM